MQRKTKRILLIVAMLAGAIVLSVGMTGLRKPPVKKDVEKLDILVEVLELETMTASFIISSQGTVQPLTETVLSAEVSGTIVHTSPKWIAGGVFAKNEVLMRVDPTNYTVAVDQAKAFVKQRQIDWKSHRLARQRRVLGDSFPCHFTADCPQCRIVYD